MIVQYGVLPWRRAGAGVGVMLITSRETRRWVIPRGNPIAGLSPAASGAQEAWEEAGIRGNTAETEIGFYQYGKRRRDGSTVPAIVRVYPLEVAEEAEAWPEAHQRERRWFAPADAAALVDEPELAALILTFAPESGG